MEIIYIIPAVIIFLFVFFAISIKKNATKFGITKKEEPKKEEKKEEPKKPDIKERVTLKEAQFTTMRPSFSEFIPKADANETSREGKEIGEGIVQSTITSTLKPNLKGTFTSELTENESSSVTKDAKSEITKELENLSPEMRAILMGDILNKKDF